ncbi:MAG: radical SAM protein [Syntrophaceae bacterium]|nr:radical SAM protein [Syntrophaceae bacterium]
MSLVVNEIFYSLQGESSYAGRPCSFVRLTGCNLRCTYCDTRYAYEDGKPMELGEIIDRLLAYPCRLVEVTGGEPLLQKETPVLIRELLDRGFEVLLETNGSLNIDSVDQRCIRIVDIKCPSSGEADKNDFENFHRLTPQDEIKFVIDDRADYEYATGIIYEYEKACATCKPALFSPVFGRMDPAKLAHWIIEDGLPVRMQLQLHKIVWGSERRGV